MLFFADVVYAISICYTESYAGRHFFMTSESKNQKLIKAALNVSPFTDDGVESIFQTCNIKQQVSIEISLFEI